MKLKSLVLAALAGLFALALPRPAHALEVSFEFFQESLSPYGEWLEVGDYGYCWRPTDVDEDWAPYADGYWTYTDAGWTWVSYEEFGGIVYHYGRWVKVEDEGWCWVPDYEWGPAWVSWRHSDDYVGWAPLPAEATWRRDRGFSVWVDTSYDIGPSSYNFCRVRDFGAPVLRPVLVRRTENVVIIHKTVNITNITYNPRSECVFNGGLDYAFVNRHVHRPVPALKLVRNTNVTVVNNTIINNNVRVTNINAVPRGNQLTVIAPTVVRPPRTQLAALIQPKVKKVVPQQKVTKGWGALTADQRNAIKARMAQETKGLNPETAPAKPPKLADLKVVPVKADPDAKVPGIPARTRPTPGASAAPLPPLVPKTAGTDTPPPTTPASLDPRKRGGSVTKAPRGTPPPATPAEIPPATVTQAPPVVPAPEAPVIPKGKAVAKKPGKAPTPEPVIAPPTPERPPAIVATPPPVVSEKKPVRPGVVKPFNPTGDDAPPIARTRATPAPNPAIEKRNATAEAARERAAELAAQRQRALEESRQQQQEALARKKAAAEEVKMKSNLPPQPDPRAQALAKQRSQDQQQQQQAARERAAQAAEARQRTLDQQQQQAAALRARTAQATEARARAPEAQQAQAAAAWQKSLEQAQAASAARQRTVPAPVQRQIPAPPQMQRQPPVQKAPPKPGKRPVTAEEAAALERAR